MSVRVIDLYFISDAKRTAVKIGITSKPIDKRLRDLQAGSPVHLVVDHLEPEVPAFIELRLHQHFACHWRHREWFTYTPEIKALVDRLKAGERDILNTIPFAPYPKGYRCEMGWLLTNEDTLRFIRDGVMPHP